MENVFFNNIKEIPVEVHNNEIKLYIKELYFDGKNLGRLAGKLKYIINHYDDALSIKISIKSKHIQDMPTIVTFEYLIYYTLKLSNHVIKISFNPHLKEYFVNYLFDSLIGEYISSNKPNKKAREEFIEKFESPITMITLNHYRKLLKNNNKKNLTINTVYSELPPFLRQKMSNDKFIENYCEAITELCSNVLDHTQSDCILSIECGEAIWEGRDTKHNMLSVVVSNVSENLFYDSLKQQHMQRIKEFSLIDEALKHHRKFIECCENTYNEDRFYTVSAFQNTISTRDNQCGSGGTGLMKTINNILGSTANDLCYILSGNEVLYLKEDKILPENGYIGFNTEHNYINGIPDEDMFTTSGMYFNGTIVHLMLVLDKESNNG